jgi:membrane protease YdiL (CAAX protease family)
LYWLIPILIVIFIEKQSLDTLGLSTGRVAIGVYLILVLIGVLIPWFYLGLEQRLLIEILEQIFFIAFAEEFLWRGYLQSRLSGWLGTHQGIILASILFGLGHLLSLHAIEGYVLPVPSLILVCETTLGGLIFGYLFYWSKSIWPGAILHLFGNVFLFKLI